MTIGRPLLLRQRAFQYIVSEPQSAHQRQIDFGSPLSPRQWQPTAAQFTFVHRQHSGPTAECRSSGRLRSTIAQRRATGGFSQWTTIGPTTAKWPSADHCYSDSGPSNILSASHNRPKNGKYFRFATVSPTVAADSGSWIVCHSDQQGSTARNWSSGR